MGQFNTLLALSPLDGRYRNIIEPLALIMSEYGLISKRITVMTEYLIALSEYEGVPVREFTIDERDYLRSLARLTIDDAEIIKSIETKDGGYGPYKDPTKHDVKACEFWLRLKLKEHDSLGDVVEWLRFALTSEDDNNIAYALMLNEAADTIMLPALLEVENRINDFASKYAALPMLGRTHGQPASGTSLGKEFNVFGHRLARYRRKLRTYRIFVKLNGASGNYAAHYAALPNVDWIEFTKSFVRGLNRSHKRQLRVNLVTTQIEPHDTYADFFGFFERLNNIHVDFCQDMWRYVSDGWLVQKPVKGEVGSSAMPHKVNPINLENAEGNMEKTIALCQFLSRKLTRSRLQRDLSDSTVERGFGEVLGYCLVSYVAIAQGLDKISANKPKILSVLNEHPEVLSEAYQTILRTTGYDNAYVLLKDFSRGEEHTLDDFLTFVEGLDVSEETKGKMRVITPETYIGLAPELARL